MTRVFWRASLKELAAQLDIIDDLLHALHVRLEEEERRGEATAGAPPLESRSLEDEDPHRSPD